MVGQTRKLDQGFNLEAAVDPKIKPIDFGMQRPWRIALRLVDLQMQMIFEKLEYKNSDNSFVMQYYVPLYTEAMKDDRFETLMYFIFSSVEQPYIEKYVKRNKKKIEELVSWFAPYLNDIRATQELISAKRKEIKERLVFDNGLAWGKGKMEGEGKTEVLSGPWEFYYPNGALKSKGIFNQNSTTTN